MAVQVLMPISYGIEVQRENDPYGELAELAVATLENGLTPAAYLVVRIAISPPSSLSTSSSQNAFPSLKYVPNWFPGTSWKREAAKAFELTSTLLNWPFEVAKRNLVSCHLGFAFDHPADTDSGARITRRFSSISRHSESA